MLVVLCDGTIVCGCADPYGERPIGHLSENDIRDIWTSDRVKTIRRELNQGHASFCVNCGLKRWLKPGESVPQRPVDQPVLPRIFFEPTVLCNLSCYKSVCGRESGIRKTRSRDRFPLNDFKRLIDQIGPGLVRLDFFNYGDPFVHPDAVKMIEYAKSRFPSLYVYTSTNGLLLDEEKTSRLVQSGLDEITFSVDGTDQETYERYRCGGDYNTALKIMSDCVRIRNESGSDLPFINWRYILFRWNDSRRQMRQARKVASEIGMDRLTWEITDHPPDAASSRFQIGTPAWKKIYHEIWDTSQISNALKNKQSRAAIRVPGRNLIAYPDAPLGVEVQVKNTGGILWQSTTPSGRRIIRLGAQLYDENKQVLNRDYARAFLPQSVPGGSTVKICIELPAGLDPGRYLLKFDMVCEGVDWFESTGSPPVWIPYTITEPH
jgi:radical SAM family protein/iron-sulfur cluster protein